MKILMCRKPSQGFYLMVRAGLLGEIMPELLEGYRKKQNELHRFTIFRHITETVDRVKADPVLRLTALLHDIAKPRVRQKRDGKFRFIGHERASAELGAEIMTRLKFSHPMTETVTHLIEHHMDVVGYDSGWSDSAVRRFIRRVGPENMERFFAFRRADLLAHGLESAEKLDRMNELARRVEDMTKSPIALESRDLAISGHEVMKVLGIAEGPEVGKVLHVLVEKVVDRPQLNTKGALLALVRAMKKT
jgi:putative nucleotidyltransferase with HDIG domain